MGQAHGSLGSMQDEPDDDAIARRIAELRRDAAWEDAPGAHRCAGLVAKIGGQRAVDALVRELEAVDEVNLDDDAGDVGDECWRARSAIAHGLTLLGTIAIPALLGLLER